MHRLLLVNALTATIAALAPAAHADVLIIGDAGNTTGVRVDAPGVAYLNCGIGNQYGNPSMDLDLLGQGDNLADDEFYGSLSFVPSTCRDVGERVTVET